MTDFERFYDYYPKKKAPRYAKKCFESLKKKKILPDIDTLLKAIDNQIKERKYLRSQNRFVPEWKHPSTWLNQGCWDDQTWTPRTPSKKPNSTITSFDTLSRARNILLNLGVEKFHSYCSQLKMSQQDIDSILYPYQNQVDVNQVAAGLFKDA